MDFPTLQLKILLELVRGIRKWDVECFDAAMDVVKYVYHNFIDKGEKLVGDIEFNPEEALVALSNEHAKGFGGTIWVSLAFWLLTKLIEKVSD